MELEVGMYVRTKEGIRKITDIWENMYELNRDLHNRYPEGHCLFEEDIEEVVLKASNNIIDLIGVGDVIIDKEGHKYPINYEFEADYNNEYGSYEITIDDNITLFFKDGLSIVTSEQFKAMEYVVGGSDE